VRRLKALGLALVVSVLGSMVVSSPALAAYPKTSYYVSYGNSKVSGYVVWYNLSIAVHGELYAAGSGCRYAHYLAYDASRATTHEWTMSSCGGTNTYDWNTGQIFGPGGATYVLVEFYDQSAYRGADLCTRTGCSTY
jgi:hypothetical protein